MSTSVLNQIIALLYRIFILLGLVGLLTLLAPDTVYGEEKSSSAPLFCKNLFFGLLESRRMDSMSLFEVVEMVHNNNEESAQILLSEYPSSIYIPSIQKNIQVPAKSLRHILFGDFRVERSVQPHRNRTGDLQTESTNAIVLKGGLHSYKGMQAFEELREQTGTPIDFRIINEDPYSHKGRNMRTKIFAQGGVSTSVLPSFRLYRIPESRSLVVGFPKQAVAYPSYQNHFQESRLHQQKQVRTSYEMRLAEFVEIPWLGSIYDQFHRSFTKILFPEEMSPEIITQLLFKTLQSSSTEWVQKSSIMEGALSVVWKGQLKLKVKVIVDEAGVVKSFYPEEDLKQPYKIQHEMDYLGFENRISRLKMGDDRFELMLTSLQWVMIYHTGYMASTKAGNKEWVDTFVRQRLLWLSNFFRDTLQEYAFEKTQGNPIYSKAARQDLDKIVKQVMKDYPQGILPMKAAHLLSQTFASKLGVSLQIMLTVGIDSKFLSIMQEEQGKILDRE